MSQVSKQVASRAEQTAHAKHNTSEHKDTDFPFRAPAHFLAQIEADNPNDPLLKQVLVSKQEQIDTLGFSKDPVGDLKKNPLPGFIHKYHGRALLIASPKCDIHCRYCFRKHFPYQQHSNRRHWQEAIEKVKADTTLKEIILSGGDPMSLSEKVALELIEKIEAIQHVHTLRIHSRVPIVAPDKAWQTPFLTWVKQTRLHVVLVVHCNHANELSEQTAELFAEYRKHNIHLLNQSVLLKDINDSVEALEALSQQLFNQGILPYYLHQLDKVQGAAHFEVSDEKAHQLHYELRKVLPGYLVPRLVREISGEPFKTPL